MKKTLLLASLLLASVTSAFAQVPDASSWKEGDEITDQIGWGNLNFTNNPMDYWTITETRSSGHNVTMGLAEVYDGENVDLYQYVELPAGTYKVECQGYYRFGTSWADDPNSFGTVDWQDLAFLYVQNGTYDLTDSTFTAGRTFQTPLMPRLFEQVESQQFTLEEGMADWMGDGNYTQNGMNCWGPSSVEGSLVWFANGYYLPYNVDGVKYNTTSFFLTEPGYIKVGISKIEPKGADSFMATNFKMYYMGPADEATELLALQDEVAEYYNKVNDIMDAAGGGMLYTLLSDALMAFDEDYGNFADMDKETCLVAKEAAIALYEQAAGVQGTVAALEEAVKSMTLLAEKTGFAGKAEFDALIEAANNCLDPDYEMTEEDDFDTFQKAYENLMAGRVIYLQSNGADANGAYDFTSLVAYPWFCNPEYEPTWDAENNVWVPNQAALDAGWSNYDDVDGTGKGKDDATPIADKVTISNKTDVIGQWYQRNNGLVIYWNDNLTCAKKWDMPHTDETIREVAQKIVNVPNGYYRLKALAQTWMNDWSADQPCKNHIYIESGENSSMSAYLEPGGWWGKDINQWKELETEMIQVTNGEILISGRDNGFAAVTGFRLYYYGETPNFTAILAPSLQAAKDNATTLTWAGDIAAVNAILATIPETIEGQEAYQAAVEAIAEVNAYVSAANAAINNWKAIDDFNNLLTAQVEGSTEATIVEVALMYAIGLGEGENDTYLDAIASGNDYTAYVNYLAYRAGMGELINDAAIATVIAEQNTYLTANYADAAKIEEFKAALATPYNKALLSSLGIDKASETNPVDVSVLLVNPKFEEGTKGWDGEITVDTIQDIAERWNCDFNVSQTINSLPAGCYQIQAQIFYRDGGDATTAYNNWYYTAAEDMEFWENKNVLFYANERDTAVVSLASETFTDQMTQYISGWKEADEFVGDVVVYEPVWVYQADAAEDAKNNHPWDQIVDDLGEIYYYPNSVQGSAHRFAKNPEAYINKIEVMVEEGGSLTFGIKNTAFIGSHWCVFDNFKLYYLGTEAPTAIEEVAGAADEDAPMYNTAGQIVDKSYKGIVIKNGVKFINK
ncbi:MAG: hypothetical protein Q4F47_00970 [Bacteroidaceae bacterium]|nr:hypothetical protein [Bacteroidaceae bacterium]